MPKYNVTVSLFTDITADSQTDAMMKVYNDVSPALDRMVRFGDISDWVVEEPERIIDGV